MKIVYPFFLLHLLVITSLCSTRNDEAVAKIEQHWLNPMPGCIHMNYHWKLPRQESIKEFSSFDSLGDSITERISQQLDSILKTNWRTRIDFVRADIYRELKNDSTYDTIPYLDFWFTYPVKDTLYYCHGQSDLNGENLYLFNNFLQTNNSDTLFSLGTVWKTHKNNDAFPRNYRIFHEGGLKHSKTTSLYVWHLMIYKGLSFSIGPVKHVVFDALTGELLGVMNRREYSEFLKDFYKN